MADGYCQNCCRWISCYYSNEGNISYINSRYCFECALYRTNVLVGLKYLISNSLTEGDETIMKTVRSNTINFVEMAGKSLDPNSPSHHQNYIDLCVVGQD